MRKQNFLQTFRLTSIFDEYSTADETNLHNKE